MYNITGRITIRLAAAKAFSHKNMTTKITKQGYSILKTDKIALLIYGFEYAKV